MKSKEAITPHPEPVTLAQAKQRKKSTPGSKTSCGPRGNRPSKGFPREASLEIRRAGTRVGCSQGPVRARENQPYTIPVKRWTGKIRFTEPLRGDPQGGLPCAGAQTARDSGKYSP